MSSGVPISSLGHLLPKLEYCGPFGALEKSVKIQYILQKFLCTVDWHDRTDFWMKKFFVTVIFCLFSNVTDIWKHKKISFFMPVNHVKEYLIFFHTNVVFSHFLQELPMAPCIPILVVSKN